MTNKSLDYGTQKVRKILPSMPSLEIVTAPSKGHFSPDKLYFGTLESEKIRRRNFSSINKDSNINVNNSTYRREKSNNEMDDNLSVASVERNLFPSNKDNLLKMINRSSVKKSLTIKPSFGMLPSL